MFNDRYGLTQAVIEGRKTMTRRIPDRAGRFGTIMPTKKITNRIGTIQINPAYKVGEVVAVAQSYEQIGCFWDTVVSEIDNHKYARSHRGWRNKMYVRADLMPHQIRFDGVRCERLQDISDEDCMKEGIRYVPEIDKFYFEDVRKEEGFYLDTPRDAFAALIDRVSGKGTWQKNPWVVVYEFELVK